MKTGGEKLLRSTKRYADLYSRAPGSPTERIREVARRLGVNEPAVRSRLKRWWGFEVYRKKLGKAATPSMGRLLPQLAARRFDSAHGGFGARVRQVAKDMDLEERRVRGLLKECWGIREYCRRSGGGQERAAFPVDSAEVLRLLNTTGLWRSGKAIRTVSNRLQVAEPTLKNRMGRWGIVRGPYIVDRSRARSGPQSLRPRVRVYGEMFDRYSGSPVSRVAKVARALDTTQTRVTQGLKYCWGIRKFRRIFGEPRSHSGREPEDYGKAFSTLRSQPKARIDALAVRFRVRRQTVRTRLQECWGLAGYSRRVTPIKEPFPADRDQLVAMLNEDDLWKSRQARRVVAGKLGVSVPALMTKMSNWGVIRGPYVVVKKS